MCDPVTLSLLAVGAAANAYGAHRVEAAQGKTINRFGQEYQAERGRQAGFTGENEKTVGSTLDMYGKANQDKVTADATTQRQNAYVDPLTGKDYSTAAPADSEANSIISSRNAQTGGAVKTKSIAEALAKAKLDAYGDVQTRNAIGAGNNAAKIDMVRRIAGQSANAENQYQGVLPTAFKADENAGATWKAIGTAANTAAMVSGMGGGLGNTSGTLSLADAPVDLGDLGTLHTGIAPISWDGSGFLGSFQKGYNYLSPFGTAIN